MNILSVKGCCCLDDFVITVDIYVCRNFLIEDYVERFYLSFRLIKH